MKRMGKALLPFLLLPCFLLFAGCNTNDKKAPEPSANSLNYASSFSAPEEAPTYYFNESYGEGPFAQFTENGILLPDGRTVTQKGVLLPDGTMVYEAYAPFSYTQEDPGSPETVMTLPDGTRILTKTYLYGGTKLEALRAWKNEDGTGIVLPDGRTVTLEGVLLSDGTILYEDSAPFSFSNKYPGDGMGSVATLPDGTRIEDPYGVAWVKEEPME